MAVVTAVSAFVLLVLVARFIRVIALCIQGVSPFDKAAYIIHDDLVSKYRYGYPCEVSSEAAMSCSSAFVTVSTGILEGAFVANASNVAQMTDAVVSSSVGSSFVLGADPLGESADSAPTDGSYGVSAVGVRVSGAEEEACLSGVAVSGVAVSGVAVSGVKRFGNNSNGFTGEDVRSMTRAKMSSTAIVLSAVVCQTCLRSISSPVARLGVVFSGSVVKLLGIKRQRHGAIPQEQNKRVKRASVAVSAAVNEPMDICISASSSSVPVAMDICDIVSSPALESMDCSLGEFALGATTNEIEICAVVAPTTSETTLQGSQQAEPTVTCSAIVNTATIASTTTTVASTFSACNAAAKTGNREFAVPRAPSRRCVRSSAITFTPFAQKLNVKTNRNDGSTSSRNTTTKEEKSKEITLVQPDEDCPLSIDELNQIMNDLDND
ncbi:unnamed protein product [Mucor circinelloides]